jgi:multiple sugar transport system permease protein
MQTEHDLTAARPAVHVHIKRTDAVFPAIGVVLGIVSVFPVLYMFSASLMQPSQIFSVPLQLVPQPPRPQNFVDIFAQFNIGHYLRNSLLFTSCVVLLNLFFCSLTGYSLAKFRFPGRRVIFLFILSTMMVPFNVIIVPLYAVVRSLGWIDTPQALIVPFMITAFGVFLMRQFISDIPDEYLDAARIDGAHEVGIYWRIILPLAKSALTTLAILVFVDNWDSFLWPLIVLNSDTWKPLPLGLAQFLSNYGNAWTLFMAACVLATIPLLVVFIVLQRGFLQAFSGLSGIKG